MTGLDLVSETNGLLPRLCDPLHFFKQKAHNLLDLRISSNVTGTPRAHTLAWSHDGQFLAVGCTDHVIRLWTINDCLQASSTQNSAPSNTSLTSITPLLKACLELKGHTQSVNRVAWHPCKNIMASASADGTIRLWTVSIGSGIPGSVSKPTGMCLTTVSINVGGSRNYSTSKHPSLPTSSHDLINLAWRCPDGDWLVVGGKDDMLTFVKIVEQQTPLVAFKTRIRGLLIQSVPTNIAPPFLEVNEMIWLATLGLFVASGDGSVHRYQVNTKGKSVTTAKHDIQLIDSYPGHTANCYCLDVKAGTWMVVGGADAMISVWSAAEHFDGPTFKKGPSFYCTRCIGRLEWPIRSLAISHDSTLLAAGSEDSHLDIWSIQSGDLISEVQVKGAVNALAWHPSLALLAYASDDHDRTPPNILGNPSTTTDSPSRDPVIIARLFGLNKPAPILDF